MRQRVAVIYNAACPSRYDGLGEQQAVLGVLDAVRAVSDALHELGYEETRVPLMPPLKKAEKTLKSLDTALIFNLFEGFGGCPETESEVADILTALGMPYTGCPAPVLRLALDKVRVKEVLQDNGIMTPAFQLFNTENMAEFQLQFPVIVKPYGEDASHGISSASVVQNHVALEKQVARICKSYGGTALVEEFIDGREFNITVVGNSEPSVLPVSEIDYTLPAGVPRILTYTAKWDPASAEYQNTTVVCPARITSRESKQLEAVALRVFRLLGCRGYARIDIRTDIQGHINVLEVNPNPDISPGSGAVRQAAAAGIPYTRFIEKIVLLALERD
ncbi:MAG TPA: ATP-grasp domain-containing protein [Dehalococcoidia bacterium]|nr:ATP-grasp domain-containing protein [Dehalococcoidia bacterium]